MSPEEMERRLRDAIPRALEGEFVTKWIVLLESVDAQGERTVLQATSDDVRVWESLGMLHHALLKEAAAYGGD